MRTSIRIKLVLLCLAVTLISAATAAHTTHPPAGHWTFDEGSGQTAYDSAGSNDGTLGSTGGSDQFDPSWTTGIINEALWFAGSYGDYVQVPHDASLNRDTVTMAAWVYWEGKDPSNDVIVAKEGSYKMTLDDDDGELKAGINGGCPGNGWCDDGGNGYIRSGYDVPEDEWTHVAAVWDGTHMNFYVNGNRVKRHQPSEVSSYTPIVDTTRDLGIGARGVDQQPHSFFYGTIDDVRIYEDPLQEDDFIPVTEEPSCEDNCSPTVIHVHQNVTNNYAYTFNYDFTTYSYTYNDYAYNTENNYNYTFNDYEYNYYNQEYYNYTTINDQDTTNVYNYTHTTNNQYETNEYSYENTYHESNTYVYYTFGDDCPESGCEYVCQEPNCADQLQGDQNTAVLTNNVDLEIVEAAYPRKIQAGEQIQFQVTVRNQGELNADNVQVRVRAYGQLKELKNLQVRSGRQQTFTVPFTVPKTASGPEDVQLEAVALNSQGGVMERDLATVPIEAIDLYLTMRLDPQRVVVGEPVTIRGMMSHQNVSANLYVDGHHIAQVRSDETRSYRHTILTREPGVFSVELRAGNTRKTAYLRVDPKIGIAQLNVPETVNTRDSFRACATVFRATSGPATVQLLVDGQVKAAESIVVDGEQQQCFWTAITETGDHDVSFRVVTDQATKTKTQQVHVIESRIEVNVFPQELTLQPGHAGVFQVKLQNKDAQSRTFTTHVRGLSQITEVTDQQVSLGSGETRTVFLRVVPPESGLYQGNITVTSDGFVFADTAVTILAQENPQLKGPLARAGTTVRDAVQYVQDRADIIGIALGAIILLLVAYVLYRRASQTGVIEPRY